MTPAATRPRAITRPTSTLTPVEARPPPLLDDDGPAPACTVIWIGSTGQLPRFVPTALMVWLPTRSLGKVTFTENEPEPSAFVCANATLVSSSMVTATEGVKFEPATVIVWPGNGFVVLTVSNGQLGGG